MTELNVEEERDHIARRLLASGDVALVNLVRRFSGVMHAKLGRKHAEGFHGWSDVDDPDWTIEVIKRRLRNHVDKNNPVDVANYAMFWWYLEIAQQDRKANEET